MKLPYTLTLIILGLLIVPTSIPAAPQTSQRLAGSQQPVIQIELRTDEVSCFEETINLGHIAKVSGSNQQITKSLMKLDLDTFKDANDRKGSGQAAATQRITITKNQIQIRLSLAGISESRLRIIGPDQVVAVQGEPSNIRDTIAIKIQQQIADQFFISPDDLQITLDERFAEFENNQFDYSNISVIPTMLSEIPLGRQQIGVLVQDKTGESVSRKIPVSIALIRDLVVAKANISKGQTLSADNIESVRRPVVNRNVRFASFEQVVGKQVQNDVQQYELIKSNVIGRVRSQQAFAIKKNTIVSVIARRGTLSVLLKDAKALDNGNVGDQIVLQNSKTKERILARVIDASTAEVRF